MMANRFIVITLTDEAPDWAGTDIGHAIEYSLQESYMRYVYSISVETNNVDTLYQYKEIDVP
jgi:hypothetical protein